MTKEENLTVKEKARPPQNLQEDEEDMMKVYTGLVVEADNFGLILWNKTHDLVRAPGLPLIGLDKRVGIFFNFFKNFNLVVGISRFYTSICLFVHNQ